MPEKYRHTQIGYMFAILFGIALLYFFWVSLPGEQPGAEVYIAFIIMVCLGLFLSLTVSTDDKYLHIRFHLGVIQKKYLLSDIESCRSVKNPWFYGWGIHLTPEGWLYNISGFEGVEVFTKSGKRYRIGTDQPRKLEAAIKEAAGINADLSDKEPQ